MTKRKYKLISSIEKKKLLSITDVAVDSHRIRQESFLPFYGNMLKSFEITVHTV